jgi:hypothetical protein
MFRSIPYFRKWFILYLTKARGGSAYCPQFEDVRYSVNKLCAHIMYFVFNAAYLGNKVSDRYVDAEINSFFTDRVEVCGNSSLKFPPKRMRKKKEEEGVKKHVYFFKICCHTKFQDPLLVVLVLLPCHKFTWVSHWYY